jgi:ubiquinone/menaquinone biosynthesis C-methylase UbiE
MGDTEPEHRRELERSRKRWDFWSSHWGFVERDTVDIRRAAIEQVNLGRGDTVLDVGCGPGVNLSMLREAVGPEGAVVAVDLSGGMLRRARERVEEHGWTNVSLVQCDATLPVVSDECIDAAVATTAGSATPDVRATVESVHDALRPGARFGLYEIRPVQSGPARALNPLIRAFYRRFGNWNGEEDVLAVLQSTFDRTDIVRTFALGTNYVAVARKAAPPGADAEGDDADAPTGT